MQTIFLHNWALIFPALLALRALTVISRATKAVR